LRVSIILRCPDLSLSRAYPFLHLLLVVVTTLVHLSSFSHPRAVRSFPTRRSSDLAADTGDFQVGIRLAYDLGYPVLSNIQSNAEDRKSTRLNSSHVSISYAAFCLKKKNIKCRRPPRRAR